jgi:hypothetical protein
MKTNPYAGRRSALLVTATILACAPAAVSQAADTAKPNSGAIPDFSSNRVMWSLIGGTDYHRIPGDNGPGPIVGTNKYRPKIVDPVAVTDNPILQPWAKKVMDDANQKVVGGVIGFNSPARCFPGGVPGILLFPGEPMEILQTPKEILLLWKRDAQIRRIYLDVPHSKNPGYSWYGESVGHYENGDTLVVDTIGLDDKGPLDHFRTPHTKQLHVVERFKLKKDGKGFDVLLHVEDPGAFTTGWNAMVSFERGNTQRTDHWEEDICAEEGDGLIPTPDLVPIPRATKRDF